MSVNEVKLKKSDNPFSVLGGNDAATFVIGDEDHTIGNALRHVLTQNETVGYTGYSVPHPSEPYVHIRVQTVPPKGRPKEEAPQAIDAFKSACTTLMDECEVVLERLEQIFPEVRADREKMEKLILDDAQREEAEEAEYDDSE
eukprot:scaffold190_cov171-Amphora_coffeaeformis.AAC.5